MTTSKLTMRKQMGFLKFNNRSYPIFKGLNVIGRDRKSTIICRELVLSKLHAIISIIDENTHLLSDFNSSNGTYIDGEKLIPYKFYTLRNKQQIIFGGILATYFTNNDTETIDLTQDVNVETATQILTNITMDNIHDLETQIAINYDVDDRNDAPTQICESFDHDAPTQVFHNDITKNNELSSSSSSSIDVENNDLPKIILNDDENEFLNQTDDDIFNNEEFQNSLHKSLVKYDNTVVDETILTQNPANSNIVGQNSNGKFDDSCDDIIITTQDSNVIDQKCLEHFSDVNASNTNTKNTSVSSLDDKLFLIESDADDTDVENSELNKKSPGNDSGVGDVKRSKEDISENAKDDSDTDIEDMALINQQVSNSQLKIIKKTDDNSNKNKRDDDDASINVKDNSVGDNEVKDVKSNENEINKITDDNDSDKTDVVDCLNNGDSDVTDCEDNLGDGIEGILLKNNETNDATNVDKIVCRQNQEIISPEDKSLENADSSESEEEIDLLASENQSKLDHDVSFCNDMFDAPVTELLEPFSERNAEFNDSLVPTQLLESPVAALEDNLPPPTQLLESVNTALDDSLAPTQLLVMPNNNNNNDDNVDDGAFMAPTQLIPRATKSNNSADIFSMETQKITNDASIFSMETQVLTSDNNKPNNDDDDNDDIFTAATQMNPINDKNTNTSDDIFSVATQKITTDNNNDGDDDDADGDNHAFLVPTQLINIKTINTSVRVSQSQSTNSSSVNLMLSEEEEPSSFVVDNKNKEQEPETQLEVNFDLDTQKIYVENETRRPDNALAHIFAEEDTQMTEQIGDDDKCASIKISGQQTLVPMVTLTAIKDGKYSVDNEHEASSTSAKTQKKETADEIPVESVRRSARNKIDPELKIPPKQREAMRKKKEQQQQQQHQQKGETLMESCSDESVVDVAPAARFSKLSTEIELLSNKTKESPVKDTVEEITTRAHHTRGIRVTNYKYLSKNEIINKKANITGVDATNTTKRDGKLEEQTMSRKSKTVKSRNVSADRTETHNSNDKKDTAADVVIESGNKRKTRSTNSSAEDQQQEWSKSTEKDTTAGRSLRSSGEKKSETDAPKRSTRIPKRKVADKSSDSLDKSVAPKKRKSVEKEIDESKRKPKNVVPSPPVTVKINKSERVTRKESKFLLNDSSSLSSSSSSDSIDFIIRNRSKRSYEKIKTMIKDSEETDSSVDGKSPKKMSKLQQHPDKSNDKRGTRNVKTKPVCLEYSDETDSSLDRKTRKKIPKIKASSESRSRCTSTESRDTEKSDEIDTRFRNKRKQHVSKIESNSQESNTSTSSTTNVSTPRKTKRHLLSKTKITETPAPVIPTPSTPNTRRKKYEPLNVSYSSQSSNTSDNQKHNVIFTMVNDAALENAVKKLGGSVVDSIRTCSVLVTNKISRSLKFLIAIALAKPIVHVNWIKESEKQKHFLDPWSYILEDPENETKMKMCLKNSLKKSKEKKIFAGEIFFLPGSKNVDVLKEIIETSGGKCVTKISPKSVDVIIICYEDEKTKYSKFLKQKLTVVSAEAIFVGVLKQNINWNEFLLT